VCVFNAARLTPIDQPAAFKAIYRVLLDRENGPKAGNFLSFLDRNFVEQRFRELPVDKVTFWNESAVDDAALQQWLGKERPNISSVLARCDSADSASIVELVASMNDGKTHCRRVLVGSEKASDWIANFQKQTGLSVITQNPAAKANA